MAKDIVCALVTFNKSCSNRQVAKALGVDHRNINRAYEKQCSLETSNDSF